MRMVGHALWVVINSSVQAMSFHISADTCGFLRSVCVCVCVCVCVIMHSIILSTLLNTKEIFFIVIIGILFYTSNNTTKSYVSV